MMKLYAQNSLLHLVSGTSLLAIALVANAATPATKPAAKATTILSTNKMAAPVKAKTVAAPTMAGKSKKVAANHKAHVKHVAAKKTTKMSAKTPVKKS